MTLTSVPIVTLANSVRVANFSSPHSFTFDDGTVLPACSADRAARLMLESRETQAASTLHPEIVDILLEFKMSAVVQEELIELHERTDFDVLLVPLPVMQAIREGYASGGFWFPRARVCRVVDRVSKTISSTRFCR